MSVWAIRQSYDFKALEVLSETDKTVTYNDGRNRRSPKVVSFTVSGCPRQCDLPWRGNEADARALVEKLTSVAAERRRRIVAADDYMRRESEKLLGLSAELAQ